MKPEISIIIPAYNLEGLIRASIVSIIEQDYPNKKIILVDDCSTDGTLTEAESVLVNSGVPYKLIRHERNKGVAVARNTGIDAVSGEFFLFFDGDDLCDNNMLTSLYAACTKHGAPADITVCGHRVYLSDTKETMLFPVKYISRAGRISAQKAATARIKNYFEPSLATLYKTELINRCNVRNYEGCVAGEDGEFFLKALVRAETIESTDTNPYIYIKHPRMGSKKSDRDIRVERYGANANAQARLCDYIKEHAREKSLIDVVEQMLLPEALFRLLSYSAMRDDREGFQKILSETRAATFLKSWNVITYKPEYFFKGLFLLLAPGTYYSHYRKKTP
ncbi:MAG: glycosyltransferase [Cloacibacillus sp.]